MKFNKIKPLIFIKRYLPFFKFVFRKPEAQIIHEKLAEEEKMLESLRHSNEKLDLFFSQSLDGFFFMMLDEPVNWDETVDKEKVLDYVFSHQRITKVNDAMLNQYRAVRDEFVGLTPADFFADDMETGRRLWRSLFDNGRLHIDTNERRFDNSAMIVEGDYICMYDSMKRIIGHFGIQRDVTLVRQAELEREVIYEITKSIAVTENLDELLKSMHQLLGKVVFADNCFVALHDKNTGLFSFPYYVDQFDSIPGPLALLKSCTAYIFRTGKPLLITTEIFKQLEKQNEVKLVGAPSPSWVGVPLKTPGGTIGVLVLQHYEMENVYSEHDIQFLDSVGTQVAMAIERTQSDTKLRSERLLLRTVIANIPDSIYCKDTAGRKTLVNSTELMYSGVSSEAEILGKTDFDIYPKELAEGFFADDQLVLQTGQPVLNREEFVLDKNGMKRWLLTSKIPMKDEVGNITGIIGIGRDISIRREALENLRESEIKLNVILQSTADGILAIDGNGKIIKTNKRFAKLWQIPQHIIDLGDDNTLLQSVIDQLSNPDEFISKVKKLYQSTEKDLDYLHFKDGRIFERYSAPLIMPGSATGRVWSFRDITERERSEQLIKENEARLLELNATKDKFFSIIAHDLKSPFNGFLGLTQVMAEDLPNLTMAQAQNLAETMSKSANNLYTLIENLLDWAQIQQGAISFNPEVIQLNTVVGESMAPIREPAKNKGVEIETDIAGGLEVLADKNMLQTVIRNLVSNAVKFTRKGGTVSIAAKSAGDKTVEISIRDNGIGMSREMVGNLFRIDVKTGRKGTDGEPSTGLGLLLCKEFIEKNGGKIWVESAEGEGSTFYFTLPIYAPSESESNNGNEILNTEKNVQTSPETSGLKILIADDDEASLLKSRSQQRHR
jgi:PAS domain S-box-containing protein